MILLAGAGLMLKSMAHVLDVPAGLAPDNVLTMKVSLFGPEFSGPDANPRIVQTFQQSLDRVAALPGVKAAGAVSQLPLGGDFDMYGVQVKDKLFANPEDAPGAFRYGVTPVTSRLSAFLSHAAGPSRRATMKEPSRWL